MTGRPLWSWQILAAVFLAIGLLSRILPLFDWEGRLFEQFLTEDGYLMLTIARNLAIGSGPSVADGTIPTNGTQPLATLVYALGFWIVGGDKTLGIVFAHVVQLLVAALTTFVLYLVSHRTLGSTDRTKPLAVLTGSIWFASPVALRHGMNCLETGLYTLVVLAVARQLMVLEVTQKPQSRQWAGLGVLLGIAFWARNDAVFLGAAVCAVAWLPKFPARSLAPRVWGMLGAGSLAVLIGLPWVAYNWVRFGHPVPVSGQAQGFAYRMGENLDRLPGALAEYLSVVGLIPGPLERQPAVVALCLIFVAASLIWFGSRINSPAMRTIALLYAFFGAALSVYYGAFFGAGYFLSRYLAPLSPMLAIVGTWVGWRIWERLREASFPKAARLVPIAALALCLFLHVRIYRQGLAHQHFQVVRWVKANVPAEAWVGAIQTGTLGFFHDRTINLDGKVNPDAMAARRAQRIPAYIVEQEIEYLVDWAGIATWMEFEEIAQNFSLVLRDEDENLAVLRRRSLGNREGGDHPSNAGPGG